MSFIPKTRKEAEKHHYGLHGSTPNFQPEYCAAETTHYDNNWPRYQQCSFKAGKGPDSLFCGHHTPEAIARREAKKEERADKWRQDWDAKWQRYDDQHDAIDIVRETARWIAANRELVASDEWLEKIAQRIADNKLVMESLGETE